MLVITYLTAFLNQKRFYFSNYFLKIFGRHICPIKYKKAAMFRSMYSIISLLVNVQKAHIRESSSQKV